MPGRIFFTFESLKYYASLSPMSWGSQQAYSSVCVFFFCFSIGALLAYFFGRKGAQFVLWGWWQAGQLTPDMALG